MWDLIQIQTVWHSDATKTFLKKMEKKSADDNKACKITQHAKSY